MKRMLLFLAVPLVTLSSHTGLAQDEVGLCPLYQEVSNTQLLRRLSLDLRLKIPSYEEYDALGSAPVSDETIDAYLAGDDFKDMVRRFHMDLMWSSLSTVSLNSVDGTLTQTNAIDPSSGDVDPLDIQRTETRVFHVQSAGRRATYRGNGNLICADYQQTEWNADGTPTVNDQGLDGWVGVSPYWDPPSCQTDADCAGACSSGTCSQVRVCAFDAQEAEAWNATGPADPDRDACDFVGSAPSRQGCGCGPNLEFCWGTGVEGTVRNALREQLMLLAEAVTVGDLPYSDLLRTKRTYLNGPLQLWKQHLAQMTSPTQTFNFFAEGDVPPPGEVDYSDAEFKAYDRTDIHSGVLTMPAFTLRFQTNRGRANRVRNVFVGKYFEPSAAAQPGCDPEHPDPMQRCYCQHCHMELEPLAAYFGDIAEAGSTLLSDEALFPDYLACDAPNQLSATERFLCSRFYVNDDQEHAVGWRIPLQWADGPTSAHAEIKPNFDAGPRGFADRIIDDGSFQETTVKNLWRYFMRRDINLDPLDPENEGQLLDDLTRTLTETDDFRVIVKELVGLDQYRRMR